MSKQKTNPNPNPEPNDGLFLLEVLIDKIVFAKSPCFSDKDFRTCVNIECPNVEPLEICDDEPGACVAKSGGPFVKAFNNGKSCLFSLKENDINQAMSKFPIKISVYKSLPCGCLPTKIIMGEATIDMTKEFVQARNKYKEDPNTVSYQALKDSFRLVGPDGAETGEIVMFLRISCFGKLIITKFQGGSGPPNIGAGSRGSGIVDRSCNPRKDFQTSQDPCACGAARIGGGGGRGMGQLCAAGGGPLCPPARDPYNSTPCEDPDDPCYCSGPRPPPRQHMACRNTDPYCLHVPKGTLPSLPFLPFYQDMSEDQIFDMKSTSKDIEQFRAEEYLNRAITYVQRKHTTQTIYFNDSISSSGIANINSTNSLLTLKAKKRSVTWSDGVNYLPNSNPSSYGLNYVANFSNSTFANQETAVYMTLFDGYSHQRTSGTQATASVNKCLQVFPNSKDMRYGPSSIGTSNYFSNSTMSAISNRDTQRYVAESWRNSEVMYFWGKKESDPEENPGKKGMGKSNSKKKPSASSPKAAKGTQAKSSSSSTAAQTGKSKGNSASTCTAKSVSINPPAKGSKPAAAAGKDNSTGAQTGKAKACAKTSPKDMPCPATMKDDLVATVSYIRIGPKEPCPVHGSSPCTGPKCTGKATPTDPCPIHGREPCSGAKCIVAGSSEDKAPVKVSTVTNPRRGVFELVIRRLTGAPLARNELMLEWTPPPPRPPPCAVPCPMPCPPSGSCRPVKCKMIVCRPVPCKPKCCKSVCKRPCGPMPCRPVPCKKFCKSSCCAKPCRPCKPCPPLPGCQPCPPSPCKTPCCAAPCGSICKSSPCLRPCPVSVGRRKRRARSHPRIRAHRKKRISPCYNRSKLCPVVRCRSVPGPCFACCGPPCPPRKCCSVAPCKPIC